jgi:hypothetical protein
MPHRIAVKVGRVDWEKYATYVLENSKYVYKRAGLRLINNVLFHKRILYTIVIKKWSTIFGESKLP